MAETTTPTAADDGAARRLLAYLDALDHERATLAGRKHFFIDGRIEERHGTDGNTHVLYCGDLRTLLASLQNETELATMFHGDAEALGDSSHELRTERDVWKGRVMDLQDERDRVAADLQRASNAINTAVDRAQRAEAERDQLSRQLDAAEAAPCGHDIEALTTDRNRLGELASRAAANVQPLRALVWNAQMDATSRSELADILDELDQIRGAVIAHARPGPLESAVTEALSDIATDPADPEPAPPAPPWLVEAGDD